jgi:enoyl-CoA hydratase/carnithine racemase
MRRYQRIRVEQQGNRALVTLAYAKRRNALSPQMTNELLYALEDARVDDRVRVIVITGEGKTFSAGGDLSYMTASSESVRPPPVGEPSLPTRGDYADLLLALLRCDKPTIARVNGHALGSGLGLVAACTFSVALKDAQFGTPEINAGLFPMMIMALLARVVPRKRLLEMMLLGEKIDAPEAERFGILTRAVEPGDLDETIREFENQLVSKSPLILKLGLRAFASQEDLDLDQALGMLRERFTSVLETEDAHEGLAAFLEKRAPIWRAR